MQILDEQTWRASERAHAARAARLTAAHRARKQRGEKHPIEDFLYTYYSFTPGQLRRWHPGAGVALSGCADRDEWRYYSRVSDGEEAASASAVDLDEFFAKRQETVAYVKNLLQRTLEHTPNFGCFGLHEWAMVYHLTPDQIRHRGLRLRLGHDATDQVVDTHFIVCSHFDAFRFFTPDSVHLNSLQPTRQTQPDFEQSACLHAGMDIYKWATKLGPIIPGELLLDAFELAHEIRVVDMQASPYDVSDFDLPAIPIETPEGKLEYARRQRDFAERGNALRLRVLAAIDTAETVWRTAAAGL